MRHDESDARQKRWMIVGIVVAVLISIAGWFRLRLDNSLEPLLPEHSPARQTILFLRDSSFATKAVLWFRLTGDGDPSDLYRAADEAEKKLDPNLIKGVVHPPPEAGAMEEALAMLGNAGELLTTDDLADMQAQMEPAALKKRMRECYLQLVKPESSFYTQILPRDPLGISERVLPRMLALVQGLGYRVQVKDGRLLHEDGRQLMMVLETKASATSLESSKALADHLEKIAGEAPPGVQIIPICGQIHTEQNDQLMEHDFHIAGAINTGAFILLFFLVSRDFRVAAVFLLPLITTGITIGWCALVYPHLSTMMIALAVTMAGSAVDYGIYVYTAVTLGRDPKADVRRIFRPLIISHLTTLGVFVAFFFSRIPAFRQLGCLTSISLVMSLLAAIFILPRMIRPGGRGKVVLLGRGMPLTRWGKYMLTPTVVGGLILIAVVVIAFRIRIDPDVTKLDGVSQQVKQNESDFQKMWGRNDKELAILAVSGPTREAAEEANDQIYASIASQFGEGKFVSLSEFWPSEKTRAQNLARWEAFWSPPRVAKFRADLEAAGKPYGFSAQAFGPFIESLAHPPSVAESGAIVETIGDQFIARSGDQYQILNYFEDSPDNVTKARGLIAGRDDAEVVSRVALGQAFAESAMSETKILVTVSVIFIAGSLLILTRSVRKSAIIMFPAGVGVAVMLATLVVTSLSMTVVSVVAAILVLALGSDYGTFSEFAWDNREPVLGQGMASILLSFLTTLAGAGAMLLARHPGLFLAGVSLTSGLVGGFLTAFIMIPGINFLREKWKSQGVSALRPPPPTLPRSTGGGGSCAEIRAGDMRFRWAILFLMAGCAQEPFVRAPLPELNGPDPGSMRATFAQALPKHFISDDTVIIDAPFNHDFAFLGVLEVNRPAGEFEFVALNQMGLKLFQLGGNSRGVQVQYALGPLKDHQDILTAIGEDFRRMYFDLVPGEASDIDVGRRTVKFTEKSGGRTVEYQFGGGPAVLLEKGQGGFLFGWQWRVQYFQYGLQNGTLYPRGIVMDNSNFHYRIIVKNRDRELR